MIKYVKCDRPICGRIQRRGMTDGEFRSAEATGWRNVPPCPACGDRFHYREATPEEVKAAKIIYT